MDPKVDNTLQLATRHLLAGDVIAHATEAVFGLAVDATNQHAVQRLLAIKQRPQDKGLICLIDSLATISHWLDPAYQSLWARATDVWPAAITWLFPANQDAPAWLIGQHTSLALRVPAHQQARELCRLLARPIVSTSANLSGQTPANNYAQVQQQLGELLDYVLPGECGGNRQPSEIRDLLSQQRLR